MPIEELPGRILEGMTGSLPCSDISLAEDCLEAAHRLKNIHPLHEKMLLSVLSR